MQIGVYTLNKFNKQVKERRYVIKINNIRKGNDDRRENIRGRRVEI